MKIGLLARCERRDKFGVGHHERCHQELRQAHDDAALEAERGQLVVGKAHAVALWRGREAGCGSERLQTCALRNGRAATPRDACEAFTQQRTDHDASRRFDGEADRKCRLATAEQIERFGPAKNAAHLRIAHCRLDQSDPPPRMGEAALSIESIERLRALGQS